MINSLFIKSYIFAVTFIVCLLGKVNELKDITEGKELAKKLDPETRSILEEISKLPKKDWLNYYRKVREKEWKRTRSLIQAS